MKWAPLLLWLAVFSVTAAAAATFKVTLLTPADDPRFERAWLERALLGHPGGPAVDALRAALSDSSVELGAAISKIELLTIEVSDAAGARAAATAADKNGAAALLADLPAAWLLAAADAAPRLPLLNIGQASDALREADCRKNLLHLLPSQRMRADAMAQTLIARRWNNVLLLVGPLPEDKQRAAAAEASIKRYGLKLVASKTFKLSADPRERELANPLLLTQGIYDVVWVVDSDGEFAATLPTVPLCRGRWWVMVGSWRWPGRLVSNVMAHRRFHAAWRAPRAAKPPSMTGRRGWPARHSWPRLWPPTPSCRLPKHCKAQRSTAPKAC